MLDFPNSSPTHVQPGPNDALSIRTDQDAPAFWKEGVPADEYHADRTSVSSTTLRTILKSPLSFRHRFLAPPSPPTPAMAFGTLLHHAVLEGADFLRRYIVQPDFGDMRSSKNREARDEWKASLSEDAVVVTAEQRDQIKGIVESVYNHADAAALLSGSKLEISGYYTDPETGIRLRIRPDCFHPILPGNIDVKTTENASRDAFQRSIMNFGYHIQQAMYCEGIGCITGRKVEYPAWIAAETKPPYEVAVYVADDEMMELGRKQYRKALALLDFCLKSNDWPPLQSAAENITLPRWASELN